MSVIRIQQYSVDKRGKWEAYEQDAARFAKLDYGPWQAVHPLTVYDQRYVQRPSVTQVSVWVWNGVDVVQAAVTVLERKPCLPDPSRSAMQTRRFWELQLAIARSTPDDTKPSQYVLLARGAMFVYPKLDGTLSPDIRWIERDGKVIYGSKE